MDVSEQQLMDCSWGFGNSGCRGGYSWKALVWAKRHGVASSSSYGRYLAQVSILIFTDALLTPTCYLKRLLRFYVTLT